MMRQYSNTTTQTTRSKISLADRSRTNSQTQSGCKEMSDSNFEMNIDQLIKGSQTQKEQRNSNKLKYEQEKIAFVESFIQHKKTVIQPALDAASLVLGSKGIPCSVINSDNPPGYLIMLVFNLESNGGLEALDVNNHPRLIFYAESGLKKIEVEAHTNREKNKPLGNYDIGQITKEKVQEKILEVFRLIA